MTLRNAEPDQGSMTSIAGAVGQQIPVFVAVPSIEGPWPGVVVVHDALGMTEDLRNQARWLSASGYLAAAPDLFHWGGRLRCLFRIMRDAARGTEGPGFDDLSAVRNWLAQHLEAPAASALSASAWGVASL